MVARDSPATTLPRLRRAKRDPFLCRPPTPPPRDCRLLPERTKNAARLSTATFSRRAGDERKRTTRSEVGAANVRPPSRTAAAPPSCSEHPRKPARGTSQSTRKRGIKPSSRPTDPSCRHTSARLPRSRMQVSPASSVAGSALLTAVPPRLRKSTWWFGRTRKFEVAPMLPDALPGSRPARLDASHLHLAQVEPAPTGTTTPMKHCVHASASTRASMLGFIG